MKVLATILILLLTTHCFGQKSGHYSNFSSAFQNIDSVKSISINCMHNNEYGTDGCDSLPKNIGKLYNLTELYISESGIKSLPNSINELKQLKELSLNYLYYFNYETELCKLQGLYNLEYLGLWMARIKTLPTCIGQIKSLRAIDLSQNENLNIEKAFETLKQLPNLETLNLSGIDNLSVIPKDIDEVANLKSIGLDYLGDKFDYKTSFDRLSSLKIKSLSLTNNSLSSLPATTSKLKELENIDLSYNSFEFLPPELFELSMLKQIKIQSCNHTLKQFGDEVYKLKNLEKISVGGNWELNGEQVIICLSKLAKLNELEISQCRLDTIPVEITNFSSLEKLDLSYNPQIDYADLFKKLSYVRTLKFLNISGNKLTALPKEIGLLTSLEYLVIGQNAISILPEEFFKLTNLKVLNAYGNHDTKIIEPELQKIRERLPGCKIIDEWVYND
jgi:leucine-rich repeat protein SHOC2